MRSQQTAWATDEPCPSCDAEMVLLDVGLPLALAECRACGYRETWESADRDNTDHETTGGDNW